MKRYFIISILLIPVYVYSQDSIISFDRPGVADLPYITSLKTIQIESGYTLGVDDSARFYYDLAPNFLLRFSPVKYFEIRVMVNYSPSATHFTRYYSLNGLFELGIGGKVKICKEKKLRPALAIEGLVTFPVQGFANPNIGVVGGEVYLLGNNYFTKWFYFNYNLGYVYGNKYLGHSLSYSACFGFEANKYLEFFIEHFAFINGNDLPDWGIDGGVCIYPAKRLQIDLSYIRIFNGYGGQNTLNLGLSYNIGLSKSHYSVFNNR